MRLRRSRRGLLAAVFAGAAVAACQVVVGIERVEKYPAEPVETGPEIPDPCAHVALPPEPDVDDDRDTVVPPFFVALKEIKLDTPSGSPAGFDQDGVCSCDDRAGAAFGGASSCTPRLDASACDQDGGVDNRVGVLFNQFATLFGIDPGGFVGADTIASGHRTFLLYIENWNGQRNDKEIDVGLVISAGLFDPTGCDSPDSGRLTREPQWCGKDKWSPLRAQTRPEQGGRPVIVGRGSVRDGVVKYSQAGTTTFFLQNATLSISEPVLAARIDRNERGLLRLTGNLAGRVPVSEMIGAVGQLNQKLGSEGGIVGGADEPFCKTAFFPLFKSNLCDNVDIFASSTFDRAPGTCDALSFGTAFVAEEAALGEERDLTSDDDGECSPARVDPALYECPP